jgi:RHS repeat-associated protein
MIGQAGSLRWLVQDHLGSTRMVVDRSGSLGGIRRHDFSPFGEELSAGVGIRSASNGYGDDSVRQKFTSKERDSETGLDFFEERYYASTQGRFTTCDPLMASAKTGNPQSWNRFVYVLNNPLRYVDPDGLEGKQAWDQLTEEEQKIITFKLNLKKRETARKAFNDKFTGRNAQETAALVIAVKNLIDNAGGHSNSEVWQQIQSVDGGWVDTKNHEAAALQISVSNSKGFLNALQKSGKFDVDATYEAANLTGDHGHSARFITATSDEPGMHFVQQKTYADTRFDVHWDPRSSAFSFLSGKYQILQLSGAMSYGSARALERGEAGLSHGNPKTSAQVRQELRRIGIVPRNEP